MEDHPSHHTQEKKTDEMYVSNRINLYRIYILIFLEYFIDETKIL